jgi:hypothetical protein
MTLLARTEATLPSAWYYDPAHYARELETVWYPVSPDLKEPAS